MIFLDKSYTFLCIEIITPACQNFGAFSRFHATWHTLVNQRTPLPFNVFNVSNEISSLSAAFQDFNLRVVAATSVNAKTSFSPKLMVLHLSVDCCLNWVQQIFKLFFQS